MRVLDAATMRQRRALERRQQVDQALGQLGSQDWPPAGSNIDPTAAKNIIAQNVESQPPATRLAYAILFQALRNKAQEVVMEPHQGGLRVLTRSGEGNFEPLLSVPTAAARPLMARLQIMANIDLAYTQRPQQGMFYLLHEGIAHEIRACTLPTDVGQLLAIHVVQHTGAVSPMRTA
jgi:type II secretory ATPase GspE/PulE/Tfp pilus assembly ATPase PilB-like protein